MKNKVAILGFNNNKQRYTLTYKERNNFKVAYVEPSEINNVLDNFRKKGFIVTCTDNALIINNK